MPPAETRPLARPVRLQDIARLLGSQFDGPDVVTGVTLDSRSVRPGDLYAALPGHVTHGARFIGAALKAGAAAVLTDPLGAATAGVLPVPVLVHAEPRSRLGDVAALVYGNPAADLQILGVTGTNGKTTVAAMVESGLRAAGRVTGMIGTVGVTIAGESFAGVRTTPEAPDLHALLAIMRERSVDTVVMEVSSIALDEHRVDGLAYDIAAFTNLSQDHLDYHGTMAAYYAAKARLFGPEHSRSGVVGVDDEWGRRLAADPRVPTDTWSLRDASATWHGDRRDEVIVVSGADEGPVPIRVPMPGAFNAANALCAYAVLRRAGISSAAAVEGIESARVPGRMQTVAGGDGITGVVDYAHSPDAIQRVLLAVRETSRGRIIAVIGAGGDRDRGKRSLMGETAARGADVVIVTDDNPRSEDPATIRAAVIEGATGAAAAAGRAVVVEEADRRAAITVAVGMAEAGDVVLVLGKGHEQGQDIGGVVTPFDDLTVLAEALDRPGPGPQAGGSA